MHIHLSITQFFFRSGVIEAGLHAELVWKSLSHCCCLCTHHIPVSTYQLLSIAETAG